MKSKNLIMITAAIITTAVLVLTAGLSLLHSSAIEENPASAESRVPVSEAPRESASETKKTELNSKVLQDEIEDYVYSTEMENAVYYKDMVFDIYENATGQFVGQVVITDDEMYEEYGQLFRDSFDYTEKCFDPHDENAEPVYLPNTKYRVEAHGFELLSVRDGDNISSRGGYFQIAFSYGADECIWEFLQIGLPHRGCDEFIALISELIADEIAAIEAGTAEVPEREVMDLIGYDDEDGYWNTIGRYVPRFPSQSSAT